MSSQMQVRLTLPVVRVSSSTMRPYSARRKYRKLTRNTMKSTVFNSVNVGQSSARMPRIEYKANSLDFNSANYYIYQTVSVLHLTGMVQGSQPAMRVGTRISVKGMYINAYINAASTAQDTQMCRMAFVCDRQANGVSLAPADVGITTPGTLYNPNGKPRFWILWDKHFSISPITQAGGYRFIEKYIHFRQPLVVQYNLGTSGLINDVNTNALYLILVGTANSTGFAPVMRGTFRLLYTDD